MPLDFTRAERLLLKKHPDFSEQWIQQRIIDNPAILGLGDLDLIASEKVQPKAGRLDLLLHDDQLNRRYEVELMLGKTDPSHIIRCIEYWDIERRRYPAYDHVAVLVAEDITSRFLNVMALLAGSIPLIAIQLVALQVEGRIVIHFVRVLDQTELRSDDEYEASSEGTAAPDTDRAYWESRVGSEIMELADKMLTIANEVAQPVLEAKYRKAVVAWSVNGSFFNVGGVMPRKLTARVKFPAASFNSPEEWITRLVAEGLDAQINKRNRIVVDVRPADFEASQQIVREFIHAGVQGYQED